MMTVETMEMNTAIEQNDHSDALLSIQNLRVWFELKKFGFGHAGYVHAVDGVSFDLGHAESIAVVGESGCGKSSLMKTILALYEPTKGKIIFDGKDLSEMDSKEMQWYHGQVGYVQQDPYGALAPFMTIHRILEEPLIISGVKDKVEREQRVRKVMEEVKLHPVDDYLKKYPHMLSGGQQQRVVIARAMILEPRLLVADEPVSMLDASVRVEVLKLFEGLQQKYNLSVIYITHDLATVSYFSSRIFVMYAGRIAEKAEVHHLINNPLHPYTHALLQGTSDPDANNAASFKEVPPGEPPSLIVPPPGCRFHPRCTQAIAGLCEVEEPPEFEPEANHFVSCWLYREE